MKESDRVRYTSNLNLKKPENSDVVNNDDLNDNFDILDVEVTKKATTTQDGRMSKEDKTKLDGIEAGANKYVHPKTHSADIIIPNADRRFVSDTEKEAWNAKETPEGAQAKVDAVQANLDEHKADDVSQGEIHGLRVNNGKLEYYDGEWKIASGGIPVGNVSGLSIKEGDAEITLMWTDPEDRYLDDLKIAEWQGTKIIRKEGSYPVSDDDGVLVVDNKIRNQYSSNGYKDTGLTNETTYYYMAFPYTEDAITVDGANRIAGTPTDVDDPSGSPGSPNLIAGTMEEGFFGEVRASEFITGNALASECGISQGTSQHSTAGWLKFAYLGEILFVAKKPIRHSISWDAINTAKCVYGDSGDKRVVIGGKTYKVTLMRALAPSNDPKTVASDRYGAVNYFSEWNILMCQIHEEALSKSWDYPNNIEKIIGILKHNFGNGTNGMYNDADLVVKSGNGRYSWCQEMSTSTSYRLHRGGEGVSHSRGYTSSDAYSHNGWRPVLRLIN